MAENTVQLDVSLPHWPKFFIFIEAPKYLLEFLHINGTIAYYPVIILILTLIGVVCVIGMYQNLTHRMKLMLSQDSCSLVELVLKQISENKVAPTSVV